MMRWRLEPSLFFISLFCLKLANESTLSATPLSSTFLRKRSGSSHLLPKLLARKVRVSLVWHGIHTPSAP